MRRHRVSPSAWLVATGLLVTLMASSASAQPIGTFQWQLQPFCNVVTLTVSQVGGIYTLHGYNDQCGAEQRAPVSGTATLNPDGSIGLGFAGAGAYGNPLLTAAARSSDGSGFFDILMVTSAGAALDKAFMFIAAAAVPSP